MNSAFKIQNKLKNTDQPSFPIKGKTKEVRNRLPKKPFAFKVIKAISGNQYL